MTWVEVMGVAASPKTRLAWASGGACGGQMLNFSLTRDLISEPLSRGPLIRY